MVLLDEPSRRTDVGGMAAVVSHRGGELTVLRVAAGRLEVARRDRRDCWAPWQAVPSEPALASLSAVTAVETGRGGLAVFVVGDEGRVGVIEGSASGWSAWSLAPEGERLAADTVPAAIARGAGRIDLTAVARPGLSVVASWARTDGWSPWHSLADGSPGPAAAVTLVSRGSDALDSSTVASDGGLYSAWYTDEAGWSAWSRIGDLLPRRGARVVCVVRNRGWLQLFALDVGGWVVTASWKPETGWSDWNSAAGGLSGFGGALDAVALRPGRVEVAITGLDDRVHVYTDAGDGGLGPQRWCALGGPLAAKGRPISVAATGGDGVAVVMTDSQGQIWLVDRRGGNDWGEWQPIGG